ncbi:hypothetical protein ABIF38_008305 [Bradyrhizobium japonicum]|uniref:DUF6894 domain-containing protein n=2 Tax=Nitrobacteraceae TaxID=41294 RepID=A0ABV4EVL8_BRAEL|nr:hypothetical protein [Bradyrhizobium elkanii]MCP1729378.1 hypothetical protein [Bradyrhizobium elkanii]MCP1756112.1 hypothetical protein [Bradyrhizobium elkanii]MCP1981627.1 hypothetical protein [Bradyrhizobium elkanii]MCS3573507.1 hypothetical protein [Bradyrhizobium elkanii]
MTATLGSLWEAAWTGHDSPGRLSPSASNFVATFRKVGRNDREPGHIIMAMKYYFDLRDGCGLALDEEGLVLSDLAAVQEEAARALADMVRDSVRGHNFDQIAIEVRDDDGPVLEVRIAWRIRRSNS